MESDDLNEFSRSGGTSSRYKMNDDDLGLGAADFGANHERTQTLGGDRAVTVNPCENLILSDLGLYDFWRC